MENFLKSSFADCLIK